MGYKYRRRRGVWYIYRRRRKELAWAVRPRVSPSHRLHCGTGGGHPPPWPPPTTLGLPSPQAKCVCGGGEGEIPSGAWPVGPCCSSETFRPSGNPWDLFDLLFSTVIYLMNSGMQNTSYVNSRNDSKIKYTYFNNFEHHMSSY